MSDSAMGYDPAFLSTEVPLPVPDAAVTALAYPHFTVLLGTDRRLATVTAVNVDGADLRDLPRDGEWHLDARVPADAQLGPEVYARNDLDRGHLVRRRDPGWGEDAAEAMAATFTYPNAAPQAAGFNQSKELWLGLEDHVLAYAEAQRSRLAVFTAPVLADDDPPYRGAHLPRLFWKVVAWKGEAGAPACAAFLLDQTALLPRILGTEETTLVPLAGFRTFQVSVAAVEARAGVSFGALRDADVLRGAGVRRSGWRSLDSASDIVLA